MQLLAEALAVVDQRHMRGVAHRPTEAEPRIPILIDEAEQVLRQPDAIELLHRLAFTGRPAAVDTVLSVRDTSLQLWPTELRDQYAASTITEFHRPPAH